MRGRRAAALALFAAALAAGSWRDTRSLRPAPIPGVLVADLHVHPFPGDGVLPVWDLQREARRRGLDVIAVSGHNNRTALAVGEALGLIGGDVIVLPAQELTAPGFHLVAVGVRQMIDWHLPVPGAVRAIHAQGGVAIAAHPSPRTWKALDAGALAALDGAEVAHPMARAGSPARDELDRFFTAARAVNPDLAPIGSTDFHVGGPLGLCRTYLLTDERSAAGALGAIRAGRTVARDQDGRLYGAPADVAMIERLGAAVHRAPRTPLTDKLLALVALLALAALALPRRGSIKFP